MKKISNILIGTHNDGKFKELSYLISKKVKKVSPKEYKIKSPKETGRTFLANSRLKANYFYQQTKITSISDDSGLSISCLNGRPGIYSARWAKTHGSFHKAMIYILKKINKVNKNKKNKNAKAKFVCVLTIKMCKKKSISVRGEINGNISSSIRGKNGFGYDPIFIPNKSKLTFGEMTHKKKILIDHRFIAFKKLKKIVKIL
jgi:XTP/dITP diphosphohydrolase